MALFKIKKGLKSNLPKTYNEGYCYFTTDDGKFYIDTSNEASGRVCLNASQADKAIKATQDNAGQQIDTTYIKGLSLSGKTITYTKGNGTTDTITYPNATTFADGLMSSSDKSKLDEITKITNEDIDTICGAIIYNAGDVKL